MCLSWLWLALLSSEEDLTLALSTTVAEKMFLKRRCVDGSKQQVESSVAGEEEEERSSSERISVLDLPELALECILTRLPATSLAHMAGVCQELRKRCCSDHLWQHLFQQKWSRIAGPSAFREWQQHLKSQAEEMAGAAAADRSAAARFFWGWPLSCLWPFSWLQHLQHGQQQPATTRLPPPDSLMAWYWALESGTFWFPAQVYNREVLVLFRLLSFWEQFPRVLAATCSLATTRRKIGTFILGAVATFSPLALSSFWTIPFLICSKAVMLLSSTYISSKKDGFLMRMASDNTLMRWWWWWWWRWHHMRFICRQLAAARSSTLLHHLNCFLNVSHLLCKCLQGVVCCGVLSTISQKSEPPSQNWILWDNVSLHQCGALLHGLL